MMDFLRKPEQLEKTKPVLVVAPPQDPMPVLEPKPFPVPRAGETYSDKAGLFLINDVGLAMCKHFEGFEPVARDDGFGTSTIGYGRIVYPDGRKVKDGETCTELQASQWLLNDLYVEGAKYVRAFLNDEIEKSLNENEFSALVDFTFNRGAGRFRDYVAPYLNKGDKAGAMKSLLTVVSAGSQKYVLGLDRRRWAEKMLFEGKDPTPFYDIAWFKKFAAGGYV
jgi:lysozyme